MTRFSHTKSIKGTCLEGQSGCSLYKQFENTEKTNQNNHLSASIQVPTK